MKRIHLVVGCSALLGASLVLTGCSEQPTARTGGEPLPPVAARPPAADRVSALGRLEPEHGLIRVAGPSGENAVIQELLVDHGDTVEKGQLIATLDTVEERAARIDRLEAELGLTQRQQGRFSSLHSENAASDSLRDEWETQVRISKSELREAQATFERAHVRAPISGRVIAVHARQGERIGVEGVVELGRTDHMFAVAEVYETDIGRVKAGQRATITSPALPTALTGTVDWVNLLVAIEDTLGTDPAARKDARVVEVEIRLDDSEIAAAYTNLQVEVEIQP